MKAVTIKGLYNSALFLADMVSLPNGWWLKCEWTIQYEVYSMHIILNDLRKLACYVCPYSTLINKPKLCINECKMQMLKTINRSIDKGSNVFGCMSIIGVCQSIVWSSWIILNGWKLNVIILWQRWLTIIHNKYNTT